MFFLLEFFFSFRRKILGLHELLGLLVVSDENIWQEIVQVCIMFAVDIFYIVMTYFYLFTVQNTYSWNYVIIPWTTPTWLLLHFIKPLWCFSEAHYIFVPVRLSVKMVLSASLFNWTQNPISFTSPPVNIALNQLFTEV